MLNYADARLCHGHVLITWEKLEKDVEKLIKGVNAVMTSDLSLPIERMFESSKAVPAFALFSVYMSKTPRKRVSTLLVKLFAMHLHSTQIASTMTFTFLRSSYLSF